MSFSLPKTRTTTAAVAFISAACTLSRQQFPCPEKIRELRQEALSISYHNRDIKRPPPAELVALGKRFFFAKEFSANNEISCATCHNPKRSFSDGLKSGLGIGKVRHNTPTLVNTIDSRWFFWNGRSTDLVSQALQPIENPLEHGISRSTLVRLIRDNYIKLKN